jgi:vancomycin resistance protein YoaR
MSKKTNKRGGFRKRSKTLAKLNGGVFDLFKKPMASTMEVPTEVTEASNERKQLAEQLEKDLMELADKMDEADKKLKFFNKEELPKSKLQLLKDKVSKMFTGYEYLGGSQKRRRQNKRKSSKNRSR